MPTWIQALKQWNADRGTWCIPRKGTPEYEEVQDIMNPPVIKKRRVNKSVEKKEVEGKPSYTVEDVEEKALKFIKKGLKAKTSEDAYKYFTKTRKLVTKAVKVAPNYDLLEKLLGIRGQIIEESSGDYDTDFNEFMGQLNEELVSSIRHNKVYKDLEAFSKSFDEDGKFNKKTAENIINFIRLVNMQEDFYQVKAQNNEEALMLIKKGLRFVLYNVPTIKPKDKQLLKRLSEFLTDYAENYFTDDDLDSGLSEEDEDMQNQLEDILEVYRKNLSQIDTDFD